MDDTLIWAAAVCAPAMTAVAWLAPAARRAIEKWGAAYSVTAAEQDAGVQAALADVAERRRKLAIAEGLTAEETERERARLAAETAQYETDRQAAGVVLADAVSARRKVIAARADAEAALAPDLARKALDSGRDMTALAQAYAAYCAATGPCTPHLFSDWVGDFQGLAYD